MKLKKAVLSLVLASAMLIGGCGGSGKGNEAAAGTKNADGKYKTAGRECGKVRRRRGY